MSFQKSVFAKQGFSVPGEIFQDVPWTVLSYTIDSHDIPNIVGSTAYTIVSEGLAVAGNAGTLGFAGFLCAPKSYTLKGLDHPLDPTLQIPNFTQVELMTAGMLVVSLPAAAAIGDFIIYEDATGEISSIPPTDSVPVGFTFANATVSQFTQSISGEGLAVILIDAGSANSNLTAFSYHHAYWAASNGDDNNDGLSIDRPILTLTHFIALVAALTDPTAFVVLNVPDVSTFASTTGFTFPTGSNIFINAPASIFSTSGTIGLFRGTGGSLKVIGGSFSAPGQRLLTFGGSASIFLESLIMTGNLTNDSAPGANMTVTATSLTGNIVTNGDLTTIVRIDNISGTVSETSSAPSYKLGLFARHVGGNITSTNGSIYGQVFDCGGSVGGIIQGIFDGTLYNIT